MSETTRSRGKQSGSLTAAALSVTAASILLLSPYAHAGPEGGQVVSGSGNISANGATTTIKQVSDKLSLNWQSFNVGKAESVNFVQPSASALAVNRIFDTQGSHILGRINANGQVWLINPNGVIFGKDAQINVGGLLASTLNPDDASIGSASSNFSGSSTAGVVNLGSINTAQGGYVALLGHSVSNQGSISAPSGTVALGAGSAVSLNFAGSKLLGLEVTSNQVNALAENGGLIQADGGQVLLSAGARESLLASVVNNTGIIQAHTVQEQEGKIILLGGMAAGTTNVAGTLDASAPSGGNGGFIETSANKVKVDESVKITTASAQGTQGEWLLDPYDFYVAPTTDIKSNIDGATLGSLLGSSNVTIMTTADGGGTPTVNGDAASGRYTSGLGDIYVNDTVDWDFNSTLTLKAHNSIHINSPITARHASGKLALEFSQGTSTGVYSVNAKVSLQAAVADVNYSSSGNFSTKLGTAATTYYTVITQLGDQGDQSSTSTNSLQGIGHSSRLNGKFVLGADITASSTSTWNSNQGFSPIGTFTGTFDGLGHTITGLTINRGTTNYVGLFSNLGTAGVVQNVGLVDASVIGKESVGGLVGINSGKISNSYTTGSVSGTNFIGGLVGYKSNGSISNSYATASVSGTTYVGGLVGRYDNGSISSSYATGSVTASGKNGIGEIFVGGLVGRMFSGSISSSYATGNAYGSGSGSGDYVGGLVGFIDGGTMSSGYATGNVTASDSGNYVGGLVGGNRISISSSYATGNVTGSGNYVGGLVGYHFAGTLSGSYATGIVSGAQAVGGLVGFNAAQGTISSSYASTSASVSGTNYIGGLVGYNTGTINSSSYASRSVRAVTPVPSWAMLATV